MQGHSAGGLIQTDGGVSILRTLYIDNDTRNPKVKGVNEFVNNVVYNWETAAYIMGGDSAGDSYVNVFNNYFISGPASGTAAPSPAATPTSISTPRTTGRTANRDGVLDGAVIASRQLRADDLETTPYSYPVTNAVPPLTALKLAISDAGASLRRDSRGRTDDQGTYLVGLARRDHHVPNSTPPMNGPGVIRKAARLPGHRSGRHARLLGKWDRFESQRRKQQ